MRSLITLSTASGIIIGVANNVARAKTVNDGQLPACGQAVGFLRGGEGSGVYVAPRRGRGSSRPPSNRPAIGHCQRAKDAKHAAKSDPEHMAKVGGGKCRATSPGNAFIL